MSRNYYVCSVGEPGADYTDENLLRCILNNCFVLYETTRMKGAINEIKVDDILILKYKNHFIGYGRAVSKLLTDKILAENGDMWNQRIDVNTWIIGNKTHKYGIKWAQESGTSYDTVKKVDREFAISKIEEIGFQF